MDHKDNKIEQILQKFSREDRRSLQSIIDDLKVAHTTQLEALITQLVKKLLEAMVEQNAELDLSSLTNEQQQELERNLAALARHLEKHTSISSKKQVAKLLLQVLHAHFQKSKGQKARKRPESEQDHLTEKQLEDLKEQTKRFIIYEFYKFTNPRQLAGETARENFINNAINKSITYALKYTGAEEMHKMTATELNQLTNLQQQYRGMSR